jgi:PAS domain S-box-containing protein
MKDDPFLSEGQLFKAPANKLRQNLFVALALAAVLLADIRYIPWVAITPLACGILICWMALRYPTRFVATWGAIFVVCIAVVLLHDVKMVKTVQDPQVTAFLRIVGANVTLVMAIVISFYRDSLQRSYNQVITVLEKIPVPIIVSDESGTITFINDRASELLGIACDNAPGHSYFSFLANKSEKGKNIQRYLQIFDSDNDESLKLRIQLRRHPDKLMSGLLMGLGRGNQRRLVTVIVEGPEIQKGATMPFIH